MRNTPGTVISDQSRGRDFHKRALAGTCTLEQSSDALDSVCVHSYRLSRETGSRDACLVNVRCGPSFMTCLVTGTRELLLRQSQYETMCRKNWELGKEVVGAMLYPHSANICRHCSTAGYMSIRKLWFRFNGTVSAGKS